MHAGKAILPDLYARLGLLGRISVAAIAIMQCSSEREDGVWRWGGVGTGGVKGVVKIEF